jgi:Tol biopolymer transport system component
MTIFESIEGELPTLLEELAPPRVPDYLDRVYERTAHARQRRAWTFLGRWLPAAATANGLRSGPHLGLRSTAIIALLVLAAILAGAIIVGAPRRAATPFGVAGNGEIAYEAGGDIFVVDPASGMSHPITADPRIETGPVFSPDGRRLAYKRFEGGSPSDSYDVVVADVDGSDPRTVATVPIEYWSMFDTFEWAPDSRSLLVNTQASRDLTIYDADGAEPPRVLAAGVSNVEYRPPEGDELLVRRVDMRGTGLYVMRADGSDVRPLVQIALGTAHGDDDLSSAHWSPDGSRIVFIRIPDDRGGRRIEVMNADGSGLRELPLGARTADATNPSWSPDGTRLAFERWSADGRPQPLGVLELDTGTVIDAGPAPGDGGIAYDWSPDGSTILAVLSGDPRPIVIDGRDGSWRPLGAGISTERLPAWQRVAP